VVVGNSSTFALQTFPPRGLCRSTEKRLLSGYDGQQLCSSNVGMCLYVPVYEYADSRIGVENNHSDVLMLGWETLDGFSIVYQIPASVYLPNATRQVLFTRIGRAISGSAPSSSCYQMRLVYVPAELIANHDWPVIFTHVWIRGHNFGSRLRRRSILREGPSYS
jgi:hypothetical protein